VQINAVRLLIAEHQLVSIRASVANSREPVLIVDAQRRALFANDAFEQLTGYATRQVQALGDMATLFTHDDATRRMMDALAQERHSWRGELTLQLAAARTLPVAVRAEVVPARDGSVLGFFLIFDDLTEIQLAAAARTQLEAALAQARQEGIEARAREPDDLIGAILANASLAAMDIADGNTSVHVAPLLRELEVSTKRATALYGRLRAFSPKS
jgi:PAS domain S-box-containing protein